MLTILPVKLVGTAKQYPFDFAVELQAGETLSSATAAATVWSGNDPSPGSLITGSVTVSGTVASVPIGGGVSGTIYKILVTALSSLGNTYQGTGLLAVMTDMV
jgi:hypothetical protein